MDIETTTSLPTHITARLALELYHNILSHFHSSKPTLSRCSLVCSAWLGACRYHLFFSVNLRPKLVQFLRGSPHASATITPYIRDVALGGGWMSEQKEEFNDVVEFMTNLENIRKLHLETWSWDYLGPVAAGTLLEAQGNRFQKLTTLDMRYISFPSFPVFRKFVSGFRLLQDLRLYNVTWEPSTNSSSPKSPASVLLPSPPGSLRRLAIDSCPNMPILSWLSSDDGSLVTEREKGQPEARASPILALRLPEILPEETKLVASFLSTLGPSLEHLEVGFLAHNTDATIIGG